MKNCIKSSVTNADAPLKLILLLSCMYRGPIVCAALNQWSQLDRIT